GKTQFRGTHCARDCDQHLTTFFKMSLVTFRCVFQACSVKVAIMMRNEIRYSVHLRRKAGTLPIYFSLGYRFQLRARPGQSGMAWPHLRADGYYEADQWPGSVGPHLRGGRFPA